MAKYKYLIKVDSGANNYKYYEMIPEGNQFTVKYGRMGQTGFQSRTYSISQFDKKYSEKLKKGYEGEAPTNLKVLSTC